VRLILLYIFIFLLSHLFAQEVVYDNFSSGSGLASSYTTQVLQDQENYIWVSTSSGVSRFDGYSFINFDINDGLPENDIVRMYKDQNNTIWFLSQSGLLSFYKDDSIHPYLFNQSILNLLKDCDVIEPTSLSIENNIVEFNIHESGSYRIDSIGNLSCLYQSADSVNIVNLSGENLTYFFSSQNKKLEIISDRGSIFISSPKIYETEPVLVKYEKGKLFIASQNKLYFITTRIEKTLTFDKNISSLDIDSQSCLWVGFESGGAACYRNLDIFQPSIYQELREESVSSVILDNQNSVWLSTTNEGLFYVPSQNFKQVTTKDGLLDNNITHLDFSNNFLWAITGNNSIARINFSGIKNYTFKNPDYTSVTDLYWFNDKLWLSFKNKISYFQGEELVELFRLDNNYGNHSRINRINAGVGNDLWISKTDGFAQLQNNKIIFESSSNNFKNLNVNFIYTEPNGNLWLACKNGLWRFEDNKLYNYNQDNKLLSTNILDIVKDSIIGAMWLAVNDRGIVKIQNDSIWQISEKDGLVSNSVTSISVYGKYLWVGTRKGLSRIDITRPNSKAAITNILENDGLITNEINDVLANDTYVFLATNRGLGFFNYKAFHLNKSIPEVKIRRIIVDGKVVEKATKRLIIDYYSNNITINYKAIHIRSRARIHYRFRIKGLDNDWTYTSDRNAIYPFLPSGKFTFQVQSANENNIWSDSVAELEIKVGNPFWLEWWFFVIVFVLLGLIFFLVYKILLSFKQKKEKIRREINEYRQLALTRQMNPHFIFNSLNSIQHYILQNDTRLSNRFLTKFSKLIRIILENSQSSLITLDKELVALNLYLELESLRFKDKMRYEIEVSPDLDLMSINIPPLLIQPFVENAIWHGIMNKDDQTAGFLKISFVFEKESVICTITDNGVGRTKSEEINQKKNNTHKSMGTMITQDRIELINNIYNKDFNVTYTDPVDEQGISKGTIVRLIFKA